MLGTANALGYEAPRNFNIDESNIIGTTTTNGKETKCTYNWEKIYGKLESGEYEIATWDWSATRAILPITINFTITEEGKAIYNSYRFSH